MFYTPIDSIQFLTCKNVQWNWKLHADHMFISETRMKLCFYHHFMAFNLLSEAVVNNRYPLNVVPNVVTTHTLPTLFRQACNFAERIESASQLERHTYLILPVILYCLCITLSMFVTPNPPPKVALKFCHFTYCKPRPAPRPASLFCSPLLFVIVRSSLWGADTKVHITHIITNAFHVNAHIADHSGRGGTETRCHREFIVPGTNAFSLKSAWEMVMLLRELMDVLAYKHLVIHYCGSERPASLGLFFNCTDCKGRTSCFNEILDKHTGAEMD